MRRSALLYQAKDLARSAPWGAIVTLAVAMAVIVPGSARAETAAYDAGYQTPRCTSGVSPCDVPAALIQSRDNIVGGSEPNQPNDLNSSPCGDGVAGTYNNTESLNSFVITDQTPPYFRPNDMVNVQATVFCDVSNWINDRLYVYTANSASSPSWSHRGTAVCSGGGLRILNVNNVTLPSATGNVAVRVQFQRGTAINPCIAGPYNDHDDLVLYISPDTDGDGLNDVLENAYCTDTSDPDTDGDGLCDGSLAVGGTCISGEDMDDDGVVDPTETDPCNPDTDGDGMDDGWESTYACIDALSADDGLDGDTDTLTNLEEYGLGTNPCDPDTDSDGFPDNEELNIFLTDPLIPDADADSDGLPDVVETNTGIYNGPSDTGTDPGDSDTDGDLVDDGTEVINGAHPLDPDITPGMIEIGPDRRITYGPLGSWNSSLTWTGSEFGLSWEDSYGIYFTRISAGGTEIGGGPSYIDMGEFPSLAWTGSEFGVSWQSLQFTRISAGGTQIGDIISLGSNGYDTSLTWTGSEFGVSWLDDFAPTAYFTRVSAGGTEIGNEISISGTACEFPADCYTSLTWTGSEFGLSWPDTRDGNGELYFTRISAGGTEIGDDIRISYDSSLPDFDPSLTWTGSEFGLSWRGLGVQFTRISAGGTVLGASLPPFPGKESSLTWTGSEFGLSYSDDSQISFTRVSAGGTEIGVEMMFLECGFPSGFPSLAWTGSEFGVSWHDGRDGQYEIYFALISYDTDGDGLGGSQEADQGTDPDDWDSDDDGLSDGEEVNTYLTDPLDPDTDDDGLSDWDEVNFHGTDPVDSDSDDDGLNDGYEVDTSLTNPLDPDTDGDGLNDGDEVNVWSTDPLDTDSDGDGMSDGFEADGSTCGLDPLAGDSMGDPDGDNLSNLAEYNLNTNPCSADTDGDGMDDFWEFTFDACPGIDLALAGDSLEDLDGDGLTNIQENGAMTSPCDFDTDGDGLEDWLEVMFATDPTLYDTDGDGISDSEEALYWLTDPGADDTDGDGMPDGWESSYICVDPLIADATADPDGDGFDNQTEYGSSTDPCAITDTDGDGMSDWWEDGYACVDSGVGDSLGDPDGDGRSNLQEYIDRTDPCVSNLAAPLQNLVNYQGRLTDVAGISMGDTTVSMDFSLFDGETGGVPLWTEYHQVPVENGIYNVVLGGDTAIPAQAMALPELYLEVSVGGEVLAPRRKITAVLHAINSDLIEGKRLESGMRVLSVSPAASVSTAHVLFAQPFAAAPRVTVTSMDGLIGPEKFIATRIYNVTAFGFDVEWTSLSGASAAGAANFGYYAFGE